MTIHRIAVLGAGNGGCAAAADLTLRGYEVRLYSRSQSTLDPILRRGGIELLEAGKQSFAVPGLVTTRIPEAVADADVVMITTPAVAHDSLAVSLAPHLKSKQIIFLNPGHTGGSLHLAACLRGCGVRTNPKICETATLTYICRLNAPARVEVYRRTTHLCCAVFPGRLTAELINEVVGFYPNVVPAENVMETGLSNINAIMHPAAMVGNAGWIEKTGGDFYFYRDGITPAIARLIAAVDDERLSIVKELGLKPLSFVEMFYQLGLTSDDAASSGSVYQAISESPPNQAIKSPQGLDHRYLKEDVGYGLVPMAEVGRLVGVKTPVMDALVVLASRISRIDYWREGLTLAKMGLSGVEPEKLKSILQHGF